MSAGGRRGPPPKPPELKILAGNPGHRRLPKKTPQPGIGARTPPANLDRYARAEWRRLQPELERLRLWRITDRQLFGAYCRAVGVYLAALDRVTADDLVVKTATGYPMKNPWLCVADRAFEQMRSLAGEFGFTPAARCRLAGLGIGKEEPLADPLENFIGAKQPGGKH